MDFERGFSLRMILLIADTKKHKKQEIVSVA